ncbi:MAG: L-lactate oxidase [Alphaproteobacteria bacterium]|jgi:isopentenyl diphosphate isomerase/L-lactate dehydrogenase-like FMN-dependent dehydrogenase|nr:L-lactate oxidase [Alphaproteobacteria bacterium]
MTMMRRDFLLSGTLAAAAMSTTNGPVLAQVSPPADAGMQQPAYSTAPYEGSKANQKIKIINLIEIEQEAQKVLPVGGYGYISSGSGANFTRGENMAAFTRIFIDPQPMNGTEKVDMSVEILGSKLTMPIIVPPMGSHGLAHVSKEEGTAKAARAVGTLMLTSTQSNLSMEEIAAANPGPKWFQLYYMKDRGIVRELAQRAKAAGYTAIAPTIDNLFGYPREENIRNDFRPPRSLGKGNVPRSIPDFAKADAAMNDRKRDLTWDDLEFLKKESGLPIIVKGVLSPKVAAAALKRGMDAIYISNHGGRAFDGVQATVSILPRIADAVEGRVPIILDGGVRRGTDVFKALALGANVVACGRPVLYGLALGGALGAQSVLEYLRDNLAVVMRLAGTSSVAEISRENLVQEAEA